MKPLTDEEKVIQQKLKELSALVEQREQIQAKITKNEAAIRAFIELLEDETDQQIYTSILSLRSKPVGLTETIKSELRIANKLTPSQMRDRLTESAFPLSGYANPLAVIYTTMNRLVDQGLARKSEDGNFEWIGQGTPISNITDAVRSKFKNLDDFEEAILGPLAKGRGLLAMQKAKIAAEREKK